MYHAGTVSTSDCGESASSSGQLTASMTVSCFARNALAWDSKNSNTNSIHQTHKLMDADQLTPGLAQDAPRHSMQRLVRLLRSGWTPYADEISAIMADAATQIESLMSQRKEWKCTVGDEEFVTDQKDIAQDWRDDGLEVVSYFVPNNQV